MGFSYPSGGYGESPTAIIGETTKIAACDNSRGNSLKRTSRNNSYWMPKILPFFSQYNCSKYAVYTNRQKKLGPLAPCHSQRIILSDVPISRLPCTVANETSAMRQQYLCSIKQQQIS